MRRPIDEVYEIDALPISSHATSHAVTMAHGFVDADCEFPAGRAFVAAP